MIFGESTALAFPMRDSVCCFLLGCQQQYASETLYLLHGEGSLLYREMQSMSQLSTPTSSEVLLQCCSAKGLPARAYVLPNPMLVMT